MRPIHLTMTAFGPFADTESIAFNSLGDNPLFLINGPTGSGKTTILDAICFALYGKTTGDERQAAQMRCDHANAESIARVELLFALHDRHYRIAREPDQQRPKLRGEGFTRHSAKAELYSIDGAGNETLLVASKVTEANSMIETITGLNVEQFRQVMVLPQGEFRRLLMADSGDREKVFGQLFQTHIYKRIEHSLKEQSSGLKNSLEALHNQQRGILASADLEDEATLTEALQHIAPLHQQAARAKKSALKALDAIKAEMQSAQKLQQDYDRLSTVQHRLSQLAEQSSDIKSKQQQLTAAEQANKLDTTHQHWQSARQQLDVGNKRYQEAVSSLENGQIELQQSKKILAQAVATEPAIEKARADKQQLVNYCSRVAMLDSANQALSEKQQQAEQNQTRHQHCLNALNDTEAALQSISDEIEHLAGQLTTLSREQNLLHELEQQLKSSQQLFDVKKLFVIGQSESEHITAQLINARQVFEDCQRQEQQLELDWHRGQATLLARKLEGGQPCPVCGSCDHPNPASDALNIPDQQQRAAAKRKTEAARQAEQRLAQNLAAKNAEQQQRQQSIHTLQAGLGEIANKSPEQLAKAHAAQQQRVQTLLNEQARQQQLQQQLASLKQHKASSQQDLMAAEQSLTAANTALELARQHLATAESEVPERYRQPGALDQAMTELDDTLKQLQSTLQKARSQHEQQSLAVEKYQANVVNAKQLASDYKQRLAIAQQNWQQQLEKSVFDCESEFIQAQLPDQHIQHLQQVIKQYETELATTQGAVNSLMSALKDTAPPDIPAIAQRQQAAQQHYNADEQHYSDIDKRLSKLNDIAGKLQQAKKQAQKIEDQYAVIGTLSDVANGKTDNRISLQRFVLSVLLDDVLIEASQRLKRMSKGRYELYRQQQKGRGNAASGLELVVEDAYNGKQRPVATLSGGESFMAALSLALGLSDVVQAYSGGIRLDTLFVDEGFGSLDPESLDLAVNTLMDLQASGRMVGVISHVPELKERINVRLDVLSTRAGSTTRVVAG